VTNAAERNVIKGLRAEVSELKQELTDHQEALNDKHQLYAQTQDELDECARMNDRLNKTIVKERENVKALKKVARFFRAQRDRIDAYLSATLDSIQREHDARYPREYPTMPGNVPTTAVEALSVDRRPPVQEPSAYDGDTGRGFSPYRDHEPAEDWETL